MLTCYGDALEYHLGGAFVVGFGGRQTWEARHVSSLYHGVNDVARTLIQLWYNGTWSPLSVGWYTANAARIPNPPDLANLGSTYVVSAQSYIESLVWTAANTHPMGAKQPGFGTWAEPPKKGAGR